MAAGRIVKPKGLFAANCPVRSYRRIVGAIHGRLAVCRGQGHRSRQPPRHRDETVQRQWAPS
jgi:hypothetical protein